MAIKQIQIHFEEYREISELPQLERPLLLEAKSALTNAYAPYSKFKVGAAVLLENGKIIKGFNQENAAYPMCLCAERATIGAALVQFPEVRITHIAVSVKSNSGVISQPAFPCGACRQVIAETEDRFKSSMILILQGEQGPIWRFPSGKSILPFAFDASFI
ncbi:MAG: cytidine deaminase [Bacteroidota bacterium]